MPISSTGLYDESGTLITKRIQSAISHPEVVEIENRLLNGQIHLQTIGTGITILDAIVHLTMAQKILIDGYKLTSTPVKVIFDNRYYTGVFRGSPAYERVFMPGDIRFITTFILLVQSEGTV